MAVNDLFTVRVKYLVQSKVCTSTYGYRATFTEEPLPMSRSLARAFNADIIPAMLDVWTTQTQLMSIYVLGINPKGRIPDYDLFEDDFGTIVDDPFPNNRPYVLKQLTDAPNSKLNGRVYMSGFGYDNVTAQVLNLAFLAGPVADFATALKTTIVDPDEITRIWQPVVVHRTFAGFPVVPPGFFDVVNVVSNDTIFSQRRRITPQTNSHG